MKSYFTANRLRAQGKAWQIRILLSQWMKEAGPEAKLSDLIQSYKTSYSVTVIPVNIRRG
ncbi:Z-ring formation inhibitor MciZ [Paenibacillus timonensis]|uniref:Z-ring formation inhibitor MciZ n=1 Tax=Paenibacillus timonensis TaxID=225915 RepID=A0ABW3S527_9BACL|nr:Z-ring formation inhibitor MciZ [Paenibacillus timonensis]MCH1639465.1 Z-ring formation inhibitor MciZ [Paenibacillus timonensis]